MIHLEASRLNAIAKICNARTYLEIGVQTGQTILSVDVPFKVGVDPYFVFDWQKQQNTSTRFFQCESDLFWRGIAANEPDYSFDLIYLDGLHTFTQTFRDFCSSLAFSHPKTMWLIDDTLPTGPLAAIPSWKKAYIMRKLLCINESSWMGDVYKVVFAIHDFFPQFSFLTFPGHGQTLVWHKNRSDFKPRWNSLASITRMNYSDFRRNREIMNVSDDDISLYAGIG